MRMKILSGRAGRILLFMMGMVLTMALLFSLASVFMAFDPDGHLTRQWLQQSRWPLFGWRLLLYAGTAVLWWWRVRPQLVRKWPETTGRLPRTELLAILFMLATEYVAWSSTAAGSLS